MSNNALFDDSMKEIVQDFCQESDKYLNDLEEILFSLEEDLSQVHYLEKFGQIIDRIMGAAKALEFSKIATMCELGKIIGYKSSQIQDPKMINIVVAVLFDSVEILKKMLKSVEESGQVNVKEISTNAFTTRLKWLSEKFQHIERSSVAIGSIDATGKKPENQKSTEVQGSIDDLLKELGML
jgi:chemotaxis protein histidine kinase CheA